MMMMIRARSQLKAKKKKKIANKKGGSGDLMEIKFRF